MSSNTLKVLAFLAIGTNSYYAQENYESIPRKELESFIYQNHQAGKPAFEGLSTKMVIEVEDFNLLRTHFTELNLAFEEVFETEVFELDEDAKRLIVIFDKKSEKTDDFLKIFKETMLQKRVLLYLYDESVLHKK